MYLLSFLLISKGLMPQQIGGGMSMQEKIMFSAMESCSFKCLISGVGGRYSFSQIITIQPSFLSTPDLYFCPKSIFFPYVVDFFCFSNFKNYFYRKCGIGKNTEKM